MKIRDLSEVSALTSSYYLPVDNGTVNRKVSYANLFGAIPGGTFTGHIYRKNSNYTRGTAPESNQVSSFIFTDADGTRTAIIQHDMFTTGANDIRILLENPTVAGGLSGLILSKDSSGVLTGSFAGAFSVAGDITATASTSAQRGISVANSVAEGQLRVATNGVVGLYNVTKSKWLIYLNADTEPKAVIPQLANVTTTSAGNVFSGSTGVLYRNTSSSRRYKHDIKPLADWRKVLDIPVVSFIYNDGYVSPEDQRYHKVVPGFIAEDVEEAYPIAAEKPEGIAEDWNVRFIVPPMLAVVQDHERRIVELEAEIERLKGGAA